MENDILFFINLTHEFSKKLLFYKEMDKFNSFLCKKKLTERINFKMRRSCDYKGVIIIQNKF